MVFGFFHVVLNNRILNLARIYPLTLSWGPRPNQNPKGWLWSYTNQQFRPPPLREYSNQMLGIINLTGVYHS
jgi:hypothetical protein